MRCTTSTPSAITSPLPVGRSGRRSMLFRSRKSSSRGSSGSVTSWMSSGVAHGLSSTSANIRSAASRRTARLSLSSFASRSASHSWRARRAALTNSAPGLRHRHQHLPAVHGVRGAVHEALVGQGGDHPGHRRRPHPFANRQCTGRHRALVGQRRQCRQLRQRHRRRRIPEPQLAGQPHDGQRQVAGQPRIAVRHGARLHRNPRNRDMKRRRADFGRVGSGATNFARARRRGARPRLKAAAALCRRVRLIG